MRVPRAAAHRPGGSGEERDIRPGDVLRACSAISSTIVYGNAMFPLDGANTKWRRTLAPCDMQPFEQVMEQIVEGLQTDGDVHDDFRLGLTSMPAGHFPVPVLQSGIKVTMEPPKGIRANILRSYADQPPEFLDSCTKPAPWKKLVFACNFFHAVIQERRKFGPIGWNKAYDFSNSDLETSMMTLRNFLDEQDFIPWPALVYVTGMINYGGRVTDDLDRRLLMSILAKYYNPHVLDDSYKLTPSGVYRVPQEGDLSLYQEYIRGLPITDTPDIFGMHDNASITKDQNETSNLFTSILVTQSSSGGGGGEGASKEDKPTIPAYPDRMNEWGIKDGQTCWHWLQSVDYCGQTEL